MYDGYIAGIENCYAHMVVKYTLFAMHARSIIAVIHLVQHDICYVHNIIVIRCLVQHKVVRVATEL